MEDVNQSSSESNIVVTGISDIAASPHQITKKAYDITLTTDSDGDFRSRIGFNAFKLPHGEYTFVIEFFVPDKTQMNATSVSVVSSTINIRQQTTKIFTTAGYTRSIAVHLHKWQVSPPEYIMVDLHGNVTKGQPKKGYLIVYGIEGYASDVDHTVFDTNFVIENGKMVMETDLNMNSHKIMNAKFDTTITIHGILNTNNSETFLLNGCDKIILPNNSKIKSIKAMYFKVNSDYEPLHLKIKHRFLLNESYNVTSTTQTQLQCLI